MDKNHSEVLSQLSEVKQFQINLEKQMTGINERLTTVEQKIAASEGCTEQDIASTVSVAVRSETANLARRLDEIEDRSRRENLLFHGFPDVPSESWSDSEKRVREVLSSTLNMQLSEESIARAHRLGKYQPNKCRSVIAKFSSFKVKDSIFAARSKLKVAGISVSEDFCIATRTSRRKLTEYGKASGQQFSIRYDKLFINKRCYVYLSSSDSVCEMLSHNDEPDPACHVETVPNEPESYST